MAIDIAGFITDLKDHAIEHGFHVHDERHFVETYSLRQSYEVELHPAEACGGPLDLHLGLEVEPRILLALEDQVEETDPDSEPEGEYQLPLFFNWSLPPLSQAPDLLVLATELAGISGTVLPMDVSMIDSFAAVTDKPMRALSLVGKVELSLVDVFLGRQELCEVLDVCRDVSHYLIEQAPGWMDGA